MKVTNNPTPGSQTLENAKALDKTGAVRPGDAQKSAPQAPSAQSDSTVSISEQAHLMKQARDAVYAAPSISADKVSDLKRRIQEGTYAVDNAAVASKIVDEHLTAGFGKNDL